MLTSPRRLWRRALVWTLALVAMGSIASTLFLLRHLNQNHPATLRHMARDLVGPIMVEFMGSGDAVPTGPEWPEGLMPVTTAQGLEDAVDVALGPGRLRVAHLDNPPVLRSQHPFALQTLATPELRRLKVRLNLDDLAKQHQDEDALFQALTSRVRSLAGHDDRPHPTSPGAEDALSLLDAVEDGMTLWCHTYSLLLVQAATALGHHARLVSSSWSGIRPTHGTVEIWSNKHRKWVLHDPDYDAHYERFGVPLNALELSQAFEAFDEALQRHFFEAGVEDPRDHSQGPWGQTGRDALRQFARAGGWFDDIQVIQGAVQDPRIARLRQMSATGLGLEEFRAFSVVMRNDFMSHEYPPGHPHRGRALTLPTDSPDWHRLHDARITGRLADLYWTVNTVQAAFEALPADPHTDRGPGLRIFFDTWTPDFARFEVHINGELAWSGAEPSWVMPLSATDTRVTLYAVNAAGVRGYPVRFELLAAQQPQSRGGLRVCHPETEDCQHTPPG